MKTHWYFDKVQPVKHPEVSRSLAFWVAEHYEHEEVQSNGRLRRWAYAGADAPEDLGHWVRVIVLPDGETLLNAFIDSGFSPESNTKRPFDDEADSS